MTTPQAYHAVKHIVCVPICTEEEFRAQIMDVRLTESNWATYEPMLRETNGTHHAGRGDSIEVWPTGNGMLVLYPWALSDRTYISTVNRLTAKDGVSVRYLRRDGWIWQEASEWMNPTDAVEACGSKLWDNNLGAETIESLGRSFV